MAAARHITYDLDADAHLVARAVDKALEGAGYHVSVEEACDEETGASTGEHEVWLRRHGEPATKAMQFLPGQQLVVESGGAWRIEDVPAVTS